MPRAEAVFECTPGPDLTASRRKLTTLLVAVAAAAALAAFFAWSHQRVWPAILAAAVGALALFALRMSGDLDPRRLALADGRLTVQTRRHLLARDVAGCRARRLQPAEIDHLARLASAGGFVTAAGGFDSRALGEFDLYASNLSNAVLVEAGEDRLIVTPDDPDRFVEHLRRMGGGDPQAARQTAAPDDSSPSGGPIPDGLEAAATIPDP